MKPAVGGVGLEEVRQVILGKVRSNLEEQFSRQAIDIAALRVRGRGGAGKWGTVHHGNSHCKAVLARLAMAVQTVFNWKDSDSACLSTGAG